MRNMMKKAVLGATLAATALTAAAPADAQRYRRHHRDNDAGVAVVAGIAGLAIGAAIASDSRRDREVYYRERGYDPYYDDNYYRERGYYPNDGYYAYRYRDRYARCHVERRWDPYYRQRVRIRVCD